MCIIIIKLNYETEIQDIVTKIFLNFLQPL
jgi:hypothetical protein